MMKYTKEYLESRIKEHGGCLTITNDDLGGLPDGLVIPHNCNLSHTNIHQVPNVTVGTSLDLSYTNISELPERFNAAEPRYDDCMVRETGDRFPDTDDAFIVFGDLFLSGLNNLKLPETLIVTGELNLSGSFIVKWPETLIVETGLIIEEARGLNFFEEGFHNCRCGTIISDITSKEEKRKYYERW